MKQKCKFCGKEMKFLTAGYAICDNEKCPTYPYGWDRLKEVEE